VSADEVVDDKDWPHKLVLLLIDEYRKHADEMHHRNQFKSSKVTKKAVWEKIATSLRQHGHHNITGDACTKKFSNLKIR